MEPDVEQLVGAGITELSGLGAEIVEIEIPWAKEPLGAGRRLVPVEAAWIHRKHLADPEIMGRIGEDVAVLMRRGLGIEASEYYGWLDRRMEIARRADELLQTVDLVATPTTHRTAGLIADTETLSYHSVLAFTRVFDITHQPPISMPEGYRWE